MRKILPVGFDIKNYLEESAFKVNLPSFQESIMRDFVVHADDKVAITFLKWYLVDNLLATRFTKFPSASSTLKMLCELLVQEHVNVNSMFEPTSRGLCEFIRDIHISVTTIWAALKNFALPGIVTDEDLLKINSALSSELPTAAPSSNFVYTSAPGNIFAAVHSAITASPFVYMPNNTSKEILPYSIQAIEDVLSARTFPAGIELGHVLHTGPIWHSLPDKLCEAPYQRAICSIFNVTRGKLMPTHNNGYTSDILDGISPTCSIRNILCYIDANKLNMLSKLASANLLMDDILKLAEKMDADLSTINIVHYQKKVTQEGAMWTDLPDQVREYVERSMDSMRGAAGLLRQSPNDEPGAYTQQLSQAASSQQQQSLRAALGLPLQSGALGNPPARQVNLSEQQLQMWNRTMRVQLSNTGQSSGRLGSAEPNNSASPRAYSDTSGILGVAASSAVIDEVPNPPPAYSLEAVDARISQFINQTNTSDVQNQMAEMARQELSGLLARAAVRTLIPSREGFNPVTAQIVSEAYIAPNGEAPDHLSPGTAVFCRQTHNVYYVDANRRFSLLATFEP